LAHFFDLADLARRLLEAVGALSIEAERTWRTMPGLLQDVTIDAMENYMTRLSKREQVTASNIANIDTPGYKTKDISFYATMQELMSGSTSGMQGSSPEGMQTWKLTPAEPQVFEVPGLPMRPDQNNVDIDREMLKLGETSFGYSMMTQLLHFKFRTIGSSINEGRVGS
jgi:flagellar basal-body rod protein FlgB